MRKQIRSDHPYPHFAEALREYGNDSVAIARALGVSQRSAYNFLQGQGLPKVVIVKSHPVLDAALTLDFAHRKKETANRLQENAENMS